MVQFNECEPLIEMDDPRLSGALNGLLAKLKEKADREGMIDLDTGDRVWRDADGREIRRERADSGVVSPWVGYWREDGGE